MKAATLIRPHITERTSMQAAEDVYCFRVGTSATKPEIAAAVKAEYKVTPINVRIVRMEGKAMNRGGKAGSRRGYKKAYVRIAKGQKIEFV